MPPSPSPPTRTLLPPAPTSRHSLGEGGRQAALMLHKSRAQPYGVASFSFQLSRPEPASLGFRPRRNSSSRPVASLGMWANFFVGVEVLDEDQWSIGGTNSGSCLRD